MDTAEARERQAAAWLARRQADDFTSAEEAAFERWCAEDPRRLGAYVRLEAVDKRLDRLAALPGLPVWRRRTFAPLLVAASVALAAAGLTIAMLASQAEFGDKTYATQLGEQRRAPLADGSLIELNTQSRAQVALGRRRRVVRLNAGEAIFEVAKDKARPFIVETRFGEVRAVGTVFSVRVDEGLEVAVSEGTVVVERAGRRLGTVTVGEKLALSPSGELVRRGGEQDEIARSMAWRDGRVAFAGETLRDAAAEFNRYNKVKLQVSDETVAKLRFGGWFSATDPEGFANALEHSLAVKAERRGDVIVLEPKS